MRIIFSYTIFIIPLLRNQNQATPKTDLIMSPFAIFAIVLTIGYVFYFGIVIAHDLYGKKGQENTNEEHFDVSSMQDTEESTQVDEDGDSFRIGNVSTSENSPNKEIN